MIEVLSEDDIVPAIEHMLPSGQIHHCIHPNATKHNQVVSHVLIAGIIKLRKNELKSVGFHDVLEELVDIWQRGKQRTKRAAVVRRKLSNKLKRQIKRKGVAQIKEIVGKEFVEMIYVFMNQR